MRRASAAPSRKPRRTMTMSKTYESHTPEGRVRSNVDPKTDFTKLGKSDHTLDSQLRAAGKGDDYRPVAIADLAYAQKWCGTFGHKWKSYLTHCANGCGKPRK